jgi:hypothetical protein
MRHKNITEKMEKTRFREKVKGLSGGISQAGTDPARQL